MVPSRWTFRTLVATLAFLFFVAPALADQVTPNGRVKTKLRAKDQPGPEGNVVGYLKPGENAVLVRTTGAWREVKAPTWTGYVPSGYTMVIPDGPTPAPIAATVQPGSATQPTKPKPQAGKTGTCGDGKPLQVHFYNVGQALSALVSFPDGTHWLVDAGTGGTGAKARFLASLKRDLGTSPISMMWITHQHTDHMNAAKAIMDDKDFKVAAYVDNGYPSPAHTVATNMHILHTATDELPMPAAPVKVTSFLPSEKAKSCPSNQNNCSIGLRIEYCSSSVLFIGDAEKEEEALLPHDQTATLLQVGHHGSQTSSSAEFVKAVGPKYAVISAGKPRVGTNTTYCHPFASTVDTLNSVLPTGSTKPLEAFAGKCKGSTKKDWKMTQANDRIWATERDGDVVLTTTGDGTFTPVPGGSN
jgi:Predicted hydrolase (metallo-beta-lactamase superfamily)